MLRRRRLNSSGDAADDLFAILNFLKILVYKVRRLRFKSQRRVVCDRAFRRA